MRCYWGIFLFRRKERGSVVGKGKRQQWHGKKSVWCCCSQAAHLCSAQALAGIPNSNPSAAGQGHFAADLADTICEASVFGSLLAQGTRCDAQIEPSGAVMCQEKRGRAQWDVRRCQNPELGWAEGEGRAGRGWVRFLVWMESLALGLHITPITQEEPSVRYHSLLRWSVLQNFRFLVIFQICYDCRWWRICRRESGVTLL